MQAGQFKLNCDGSVQLGTKKVAAGGVLHGQCGFVLFCYAHNVGFCSVIHAELWSILIGVWIAWSRGNMLVILHHDYRSKYLFFSSLHILAY